MIDMFDLRIGNWVDYSGIYDTVDCIDPRYLHLTQYSSIEYKDVSPIPLSPEVLIACGFETDHTDEGEIYYSLRLSKNRHHDLCLLTNSNETSVYLFPYDGDEFNYKYLHQLQNLFYSLTNKELNYKP